MTVTRCKPAPCRDGGLGPAIKDLLNAQGALFGELFQFVGTGARQLGGSLHLPRTGSCCDIPEACWMPKSLGEVSCRLTPRGSGEVRLTVTNNDFRSHPVTLRSAGPHGGLVSFSPAGLTLGPKERATIVAHVTAPPTHGTYELLLWVSVCSDHYLRWVLDVGEEGCECCYEVSVDDNPDYVVHWYDHFYCMKPCLGRHGRD
jgi:hypothetical protein